MNSQIASSMRLVRWSLVFVWIATAIVSVWELNGQSMGLLDQAGITNPQLAKFIILAGAFVDLLLGLAMAFRPGRIAYIASLGVMIAMALVATVVLPLLWLHPLGPLMKNIPIAACLWHLLQSGDKR